MSVDSSTYIRKLQCCKSIPNVRGPQGPQGPEGPQGPAGPDVGILQYSFSMERNNFPNPFTVAGVDPSTNIVTGRTSLAAYNTPFSARNNHLFLKVNTITGTDPCTFTIRGTSLSESTAIPVIDASEVISFSPSNNTSYQSIKKWYDISLVQLNNISSINYDIAILGYVDFLNQNVKITGYRAEIESNINTNNTDIRFQIKRVKQNSPDTDIIPLEDIEIDGDGGTSGNGAIIDNLRTGDSSRSYQVTTTATLWQRASFFVLKQTDFDTYFTSDQNVINGANNEGIVMKISWNNNNDRPVFFRVQVYFEKII